MVFIKRFLCFKNLIHKQKKEDLKEKDNAGDLFNELYYICKERYSEEKNGLNKKDKNKDLRMTMSTSVKKNKKNNVIKSLIKTDNLN